MTTQAGWSRIEVRVREGYADPAGVAALQDLKLAGLSASAVRVHKVFYVSGIARPEAVAERLFIDPVLEEGSMEEPIEGQGTAVSVWKQVGVMDPVEASVLRALRTLGEEPGRAVTGTTYWIESDASPHEILSAVMRSLANEVMEEIGIGSVPEPRDLPKGRVQTTVAEIPLDGLSDTELVAISQRHTLALNAEEMRVIRDHFETLGRAPRLGELETIAQTWSEHCKHKSLTSPIEYTEDGKTERIDGLLQGTVFGATRKLDKEWCVSVFKDNAGVVRFDEQNDICFKVETHNHPSAIEPYGGAGTGIGGVIRDILGTGLAARPIANTDIFCFGELDTTELPKGVLHPLRVMKGVVEGVRDYGNRMGIPTLNGALFFDDRYLGNPIVYCGTLGIMPRGMHEKAARSGDRIVAVGGRTGRDGIHGATFSSEALHDESETVSSGAVQIGNPIEEKRVLDTLLQARDLGLYSAVTDCGAAGFSSAVGEMGEECGAEVWLERAPLKYLGLNPVEIWISEAQERMVLAVPPEHETRILDLFAAEDVEATVIGEFNDTGRLLVKYEDLVVVDLDMHFLHNGLPKTPRKATWSTEGPPRALPPCPEDLGPVLFRTLSHGNVCSKEWVVRQYDHEVQGGSAVKPLVGAEGRGPGNAAVVAPVFGKRTGVVIGCGINPRYGDLDPYRMAMCAVDEAVRNVVAVGADPDRIALLDNFSWGNPSNPETLGSIVRAARGCHDAAMLFGTPFISGKDSLNNEFRGEEETIRIPHTLLVSAMGQMKDVTKAITSDGKRAGSKLVLVGETFDETGGGYLGGVGGEVPAVRESAPKVMREVARLLSEGKVLACHDLSEGGLAVAATEMAIGGDVGVRIDPDGIPLGEPIDRLDIKLFSESASRFLLEVSEPVQLDVPHTVIGELTSERTIDFGPALRVPLDDAREAFFCWEKVL
ncbi:MAG: phosphoribosylformylglycinamidine synthase subunit PurL [Planctomycetota bacterium]|jgi:phosphoribosylformylglycinamidine synthase